MIDSHLRNIINSDIEKNSFSEGARTASVRPIFKMNEHKKVENYRPLNILNFFSKIYEKYILEQFKLILNDFSQHMAVYSSIYSSIHVLKRLIEHWKKALD